MVRTQSIRLVLVLGVLAASLALSGCANVFRGLGVGNTPAPTVAAKDDSVAPVTPTPTLTPINGPIIDAGPRPGAMGNAEPFGQGWLLYTLVDGDMGPRVCERFGRSSLQAFPANPDASMAGFPSCDLWREGEMLMLTNDSRREACERYGPAFTFSRVTDCAQVQG